MRISIIIATVAAVASASPIQKRARYDWEDYASMDQQTLLNAVDFETGLTIPKFHEMRQAILELGMNPKQVLCNSGKNIAVQSEVEATESLRSGQNHEQIAPKSGEDVESTEEVQQDAEQTEDQEDENQNNENAQKRLQAAPRGKGSKQKAREVAKKIQDYHRLTEGSFMNIENFYCKSNFWQHD